MSKNSFSVNFSKGVNSISSVGQWFLKNNLIYYYWYHIKDKKAFIELGKKRSGEAIDRLIEGMGGIKNFVSVQNTINCLIIRFKSRYLIKNKFLESYEGFYKFIDDHYLKIVFDWQETTPIVIGLKKEMKKAKNSFITLDLD